VSSASFTSRLLPPLSAAIACWALLLSVPQFMRWENGLQRIMAKLCYPSYDRVSGLGTHQEPLSLSKIQQNPQVAPPFIVEMGEDPDRIFDSRPLSPSDTAVLLDAMKKSGASSVMIAAPLAWSDADPFALDALELVMAGFSSCVTSAPLGRGVEEEAMPPALVRASMRVTRVIGSAANLPVVNRVTVASTFLGRENTWAGFSTIESETPTPGTSWLLARWGDRVIFSSTLLAVLQRENIHPEELTIEPGISIQSPRTGHVWEIDVFGRCHLDDIPVAKPDMQAPQLIRPEPEHLALLQQHQPPVHLLRQEQNAGSAAPTQQLLESLYATPRLLHRVSWQRLSLMAECSIISLLAFQAVVVAGFARRKRLAAAVVVAVLWFVALCAGHTWLPLSPALLAFVIAYRLAPRSAAVAASVPAPATVAEPAQEVTAVATEPVATAAAARAVTAVAPAPAPPKPKPSAPAQKSARKHAKKSPRGKKKA